MTLLILNGGSCSGKSTIIKHIMKQKEHLFHLSYDALKWHFSHYHHTTHYDDIQEVILAIAESVFKLKYDIISDSALYKKSRDKLVALAKSFGYEVIEINLTAEPEVLAQRFDERVAGSLADPSKRISNLSKDRFWELIEIFEQNKNPLATLFRTDNQSIEEVAEQILKFL